MPMYVLCTDVIVVYGDVYVDKEFRSKIFRVFHSNLSRNQIDIHAFHVIL